MAENINYADLVPSARHDGNNEDGDDLKNDTSAEKVIVGEE